MFTFIYSLLWSFDTVSSSDELSIRNWRYLLSAVEDLRYQHAYHPVPIEQKCPALAKVLNEVSAGMFGDGGVYEPWALLSNPLICSWLVSSLLNTIRQGDYYLLTDDFDSYIAALAMVDDAYLDRDEWIKKSIRTTAKVCFHVCINT